MKILKIFLGSLAGLWCLGIFLKLLRTLPLILGSLLGSSRLLGAVAGIILTGVLCCSCFRGAFKPATGEINQTQTQSPASPLADPNPTSKPSN
jgi:hypothetical protein